MEKLNQNNKGIDKWAKQAIDLLDEVKPYRSIFYKQRVAKLKRDYEDLKQNQSTTQAN